MAEPNARFTIRHALASPRLVLKDVACEHVEGGVHRLRATVANDGWLPTHLTRRGLESGAVAGVAVALELPEGTELIAGEARTEIGHLAGRVTRRGAYDPWRRPWGDDARVLTWVVRCSGTPAPIAVAAACPKGGRATAVCTPKSTRRT